jgi:hypothetical protein
VRILSRQHKYGAIRTEVDGISFPSKKEASRWSSLRLLERIGEIGNLKRQTRFALEVNGHLICHYVCDFDYTDRSGNRVVEDSKGVKTDVYRIKHALMYAIHGISILET